MSEFGHSYSISSLGCIDAWGAGPFSLRVGKRRYYFTDSDMFGPLLESKHGKVLDNQPISERHPFWVPYMMWRKLGRKGRKVGRWTVCRWRLPRKGTYWKDGRGISHFLTEPCIDAAGYVKVSPPTGDT
jgi:hypothetical protein